MEVVRAGLPADTALAGVTAMPAKFLGIDGDVGSLAEGMRADLLVFANAHPLDPRSRLERVYHNGVDITEEDDS